MSLAQRNMETTLTNRENLNARPGKAPLLKTNFTRRPPLVDVAHNKINKDNGQSNVANKKPVINGNLSKPKTSKVEVRKPEPVEKKLENKTRTINSIASLRREESTTALLKNIDLANLNGPRVVEEGTSFSSKFLGLTDVDANDKDDPFLVAEYIQDIFCHLRTLESQHGIRENYLATHRSTPRMRRVLVNWLVDVNINFKFLPETLHLTVAIIDRYLQLNNNVGHEVLQLVGIAAMLIAVKYEETFVPELNDFVYICDNSFNYSQLIKMEVEILGKLKFNLGRPLAIHFLRRYNKIARTESDQHNLGKYLLEICLLEYELCHIKPSMQAAAASCLSISIINEVSDPAKVWNKTLVQHSTYSYADIKSSVLKMAYFLSKMDKSKFQAIRKKYAASEFGKISVNPKLQGPLVKRLVQEAQLLKKA